MKKLNGLLCATRKSISAQIDEPRTLLAHYILVQFIFITQCGLWIYMFWACHCSYISLYRHLHIHIYSGDICIYVHTCRAYVLNWRRILLLRSSHQSFQNSVPINLFIYFFSAKGNAQRHSQTAEQASIQCKYRITDRDSVCDALTTNHNLMFFMLFHSGQTES